MSDHDDEFDVTRVMKAPNFQFEDADDEDTAGAFSPTVPMQIYTEDPLLDVAPAPPGGLSDEDATRVVVSPWVGGGDKGDVDPLAAERFEGNTTNVSPASVEHPAFSGVVLPEEEVTEGGGGLSTSPGPDFGTKDFAQAQLDAEARGEGYLAMDPEAMDPGGLEAQPAEILEPGLERAPFQFDEFPDDEATEISTPAFPETTQVMESLPGSEERAEESSEVTYGSYEAAMDADSPEGTFEVETPTEIIDTVGPEDDSADDLTHPAATPYEETDFESTVVSEAYRPEPQDEAAPEDSFGSAAPIEAVPADPEPEVEEPARVGLDVFGEQQPAGFASMDEAPDPFSEEASSPLDLAAAIESPTTGEVSPAIAQGTPDSAQPGAFGAAIFDEPTPLPGMTDHHSAYEQALEDAKPAVKGDLPALPDLFEQGTAFGAQRETTIVADAWRPDPVFARKTALGPALAVGFIVVAALVGAWFTQETWLPMLLPEELKDESAEKYIAFEKRLTEAHASLVKANKHPTQRGKAFEKLVTDSIEGFEVALGMAEDLDEVEKKSVCMGLREIGVAYVLLKQPKMAVTAYESFLGRCPKDSNAKEVREVVQAYRAKNPKPAP